MCSRGHACVYIVCLPVCACAHACALPICAHVCARWRGCPPKARWSIILGQQSSLRELGWRVEEVWLPEELKREWGRGNQHRFRDQETWFSTQPGCSWLCDLEEVTPPS